MIRTRFETSRFSSEPIESAFEIEMPYPVRIGDEVEIDATGRNWTVKSVAWIIMEDGTVELIVKL